MRLRALFKHHYKVEFYKLQDPKIALGFVVMGLGVFVITMYFLILGILMPRYISDFETNQSSVEILLSAVCYYFLVDLFIRVLIESQSSVKLKPYLLLPIRKRTLVNFLQYKAFFSVFNFLPFVLFSISFFKIINVQNGGIVCLNFFILIIFHSLLNSTISFHIGKTIGKHIISWLLILTTIGGIIYMSFNGYIDISEYYRFLFINIIESLPLSLILLLAYSIIFYSLGFHLKKYLNVENLKDSTGVVIDLARFFNKETVIGNLMLYETRIILRSKKFRIMLPLQLIFSNGYALTLLLNENLSSVAFKSFAFLYIILMSITSYAGMFFSMEGKYYPLLVTSNFSNQTYIKAKYYVLIGFTVINVLISMWTLFIDVRYVMYIFTLGLYVIGVVIPIIIYVATYNRGALDLTESSFFGNNSTINIYQIGAVIGFSSFLFIIIGVSSLLNIEYWGLGLIAVISISSMFFLSKNIEIISEKLKRDKYDMIQSFQQ